MTKYIGVDPGVKGAIACIHGDRAIAEAMPRTIEDLARLRYLFDDSKIALESPAAVVGESSRSAMVLGEWIGAAKMMAAICDADLIEVTPQQWKRKVFFKQPEGKGRQLDKAAAIAMVNRIYGTDFKKGDDGMAEAILIARYRWLLDQSEKS